MIRVLFYILVGITFGSCAHLNMYESTSHIGHENSMSLLKKQSEGYIPEVSPDDRLSVSVWGHEDLSVGSVYGIYNSNEVFGKWLVVGLDSTILLPRLGRVKVAGLTTSEIRDSLTSRYSTIIRNPVVDVRVHNHEVSVMGQVISPGNYPLSRAKSSMEYFITSAGGADYYANYREVIISRGGVSYQVDLTKVTALDLKEIAMMPGDVLYVPTKGGKFWDKKSSVFIAVASITTTLLLIFTATK